MNEYQTDNQRKSMKKTIITFWGLFIFSSMLMLCNGWFSRATGLDWFSWNYQKDWAEETSAISLVLAGVFQFFINLHKMELELDARDKKAQD